MEMNKIWSLAPRHLRAYAWREDGGSGYWDNIITRAWEKQDKDLVPARGGQFYALFLSSGQQLLVFSMVRLHGLLEDRQDARISLGR